MIRASREGELLFQKATGAPLSCLTQTDTCFACLSGKQVLFADEDGGVLGTAPAPDGTLDLAPSSFGAAALSHDGARGRRQAVLTHIAQPQAEPQEQPAALKQLSYEAEIAVESGYLVCSAQDMQGVQVRHVAADGTQIFSTRTPIHTAADALEWLCAAVLEDGSILLGGRYLTGEGEAALQEGVYALLTPGGVLRQMETISDAGAVCAIETAPESGILLHTVNGGEVSLEADAVHAYSMEERE